MRMSKNPGEFIILDTPPYRNTPAAIRVAGATTPPLSLPEDDALRGDFLMADGLLDYFPNALAAVARHSKLAGDKHHPGEPVHWERSKSTDHRNKILRHLVDAGDGRVDKDGNLHSVALAWRALALAQEEQEALFGYPPPRNARD